MSKTKKKYCPRCRKDVEITESSGSKKCVYCSMTLEDLREVIGDAARQKGLIVEDDEG